MATTENEHSETPGMKERIALEYDGNALATEEQVLGVLKGMEFDRVETGALLGALGGVAAKQVVEVHFYLPSTAEDTEDEDVIWQGRGIGAGVSDGAYWWQQEANAEDINPLDKGQDAAFAAAVSAGITNLHPDGALYSQTGIMVMNLPGMGADPFHRNKQIGPDGVRRSNRLSWKQVGALLRGDNRPTGEALAQATTTILKENDSEKKRLHLIGSSQSTAQVPAIAATLLKNGEVNLASINFLEPVNLEKRPVFGVDMLPGIIQAGLKFGWYLDANHKVYQDAKEKVGNGEVGLFAGVRKLLGATVLYALSLHGEALSPLRDPEVVKAANKQGTVINIGYGTRSELKSERQALRAAESLKKLGYENVIVTPFQDALHGISVSGPAFVGMAEKSIEALPHAA